jgi:hypothetical protein
MAANYPFANHTLMAAALGGFIYAGGGNASPDKTYRYDPNTNTWDDAAVADLPAGRSAAASGVYNGRWLLAGGDVNFVTSNSVIARDPATNTWTDLANMVQARDYLEGATAGQSFYAVAGNSVAEGLLGIARPHLLLDAVQGWPADVQLYVPVCARIVIGLLLFFAASSCRLPRFTRVIGVIAFLAGTVIAFIGASRLSSMVHWVSGQPNWMIQLLYVLAAILGALLAYSGSSKRTTSDA